MKSLGHACIFCTSNPRGHTTFFAAYILRAIRYPLEASSSIFSVASQILCQAHHSLPSTAAIPVRYRALCCHLRNWGTTLFCDPLQCDRTSASPFHFRTVSLHQQ